MPSSGVRYFRQLIDQHTVPSFLLLCFSWACFCVFVVLTFSSVGLLLYVSKSETFLCLLMDEKEYKTFVLAINCFLGDY